MQNDRKKWLSLLAKAPSDQLTRQWQASGLAPDYQIIRAPEIGGVMTRGRMGSTGAAFNLGEITVTRCSVRLATGERSMADDTVTPGTVDDVEGHAHFCLEQAGQPTCVGICAAAGAPGNYEGYGTLGLPAAGCRVIG